MKDEARAPMPPSPSGGDRVGHRRAKNWWRSVPILVVTTMLIAATMSLAAADPIDPPNGGTGGNTAGPGPGTDNPGNNRALLRVTAVGDRTEPNVIAPLAGAQFAAFLNAPITTVPPNSQAVAWCTTDVTGQCWMDVQSSTGAGQQRSYLIAEVNVPVGWNTIDLLRTSSNGSAASSTEEPYRFVTGATNSNSVNLVPIQGTGLRSGPNTWAHRRDNPPLPSDKCGLDIGLVVDLSESVAQAGGALQNIRAALTSFITTLNGTSSHIAIHTFGTFSPAGTGAANANLGLTPVSDQATLLAKAGAITTVTPAQWTNWDRGLYSFASQAADLDVVVMMTDGYPTRYAGTNQDGPGGLGDTQGPAGVSTRFFEVVHGIASANYLKSQGVRVIPVGIGGGAGGNPANLAAISGPTPNSDFFQITDFAALEAFLNEQARRLCEGTVNVTKRVVPVGADPDTTPGDVTSGWTFTATGTGNVVKLDGTPDPYGPSATGVTDGNGVVPFRVDFTAGVPPLTIRETQQAAHVLVPWGAGQAHTAGDFARCDTNLNPGVWLDITNVGSAGAGTGDQVGFVVDPVANASVRCEMRNQAQDQTAQMRVNKVWQVYVDGELAETTAPNQAPTLVSPTVTLALDSPANPNLPATGTFGQLYSNLVLDTTVTISETVTGLPPLCIWDPDQVVFDPPLPGGVLTLTIASTDGVNEVTITNRVDCETKLTLAKSVVGGDADVDEWLLTAHPALGAPGALPGPTGIDDGSYNVTGNVTAVAIYPLGEEALTPSAEGYVQDFDPTQTLQWQTRHAAGATGSWECYPILRIEPDGTPVFNTDPNARYDGRNGGVQVPLGSWSLCVAVNRPQPTLELIKWIDDNGVLTRDGADLWTLTAGDWVHPPTPLDPDTGEPIGPYPGSQDDVSAPGGFDPTAVMPGTYTLSETDAPAGYVNGTVWTCVIDDGDPFELPANNQLVLDIAESASCEIINTKIQPTVELAKSVSLGGVDWDGQQVGPGDELVWTVTVANTGTVAYSGDLFTDDLTSTLAGVTLDGAPDFVVSDPAQVAVSYTAPTLTGTATDLAAGSTVTVTYAGTVKSQAELNAAGVTEISNVVVPPDDGVPECPVPADCDTNNDIRPVVELAKSVTLGGVDWDGQQVGPGDELVWTVTVANTGTVAYSGDLFTDDLTSTLAGVTLDGAPDFVVSDPAQVAVSYTAPTLTGTATDLAAGATVTVTYTGTVKSQAELNAAGVTEIFNVVVPPDDGVPECPVAADCDTDNDVKPVVELAKSVTRDGADWDGEQVGPGDELVWTVTVANTGTVAYSGDLFTDDLTSTLAGVTLDGAPDFVVSDPAQVTVSYAAPVLTATATDLAAGATVTVTYTGTVKSQAELNAAQVTEIFNVVVPPDDGVPECPVPADCDTNNDVKPVVELAKSVTLGGVDWDGQQVGPGDELVWTVTVANTGTVAYSGDLFTDDLTSTLAGVTLDGAPDFVVSDPAQVTVSYAAPVLTATATDLAAGATVTVTDTGTVKSQAELDAAGVTEIFNVVVPPDDGVPECPVAADCDTDNDVDGSGDVGIVKTRSNLDSDYVAVGDVFDYILTVTNHGTTTATNVVVTDEVPEQLAVVEVTLPDGWVDGTEGNTVSATVDELAAGASAEIRVTVEVLPGALPDLFESTEADPIVNQACVAADRNDVTDNDCDDDEVPVEGIAAVVTTSCENDAPLLGYEVVTTSGLSDLPITLTWTPDDAVATTDPADVVLTLASGDSGEILWPGVFLTPSGVSLDWPGWRRLTEDDYDENGDVIWPDELLYNGLVLDDGELDYAWRGDTTVVFSVNPDISFTVAYPPTTPDCEVARRPELTITKTADVEEVEPGEIFNYTLVVRNHDLGAASPVVVTDVIPADLDVVSITTSTTAFPRWQDCAVTGADARGYGGTLRCELFGPLWYDTTAPEIVLEVRVDPEITASRIDNTAVVDWTNVEDPDDTGQDDDEATVTVDNELPKTGSDVDRMAALGFASMLLGAALVLVGRRRSPRRRA